MAWKMIVSAALLVVVLMAGTAQAQQYPPESTTTSISVLPTSVVQTTTTRATSTTRQTNVNVSDNRNDGAQVAGRLARTGGGNVATAVRVGVLLMVAGFVIYLVGRRRRALQGQR